MDTIEQSSLPNIDRESIAKRILSFVQNEIQDRDMVLTMATPSDSVIIDSIDIMRVLFKIEDQFGVEVQLSAQDSVATVGDLVNALVDLIVSHR